MPVDSCHVFLFALATRLPRLVPPSPEIAQLRASVQKREATIAAGNKRLGELSAQLEKERKKAAAAAAFADTAGNQVQLSEARACVCAGGAPPVACVLVYVVLVKCAMTLSFSSFDVLRVVGLLCAFCGTQADEASSESAQLPPFGVGDRVKVRQADSSVVQGFVQYFGNTNFYEGRFCRVCHMLLLTTTRLLVE